ncbi:SDR family oxidoreductase [Solihabitans fulvus]|uniref:SDR family oxidoreductase n=1 Tax=Solihabitans fulvus TaxID=1892852 RepID=A0A5B2XI23_9PSEU|nr:SDR family oxidoreductase [Solihabitans fulvus]KAA2262581.1 SDR family oxidoreductase [Solihabitans fulvus]
MTGLAGKVALVTGASRGIGRAIAGRLAADGALVAVHYGSNEQAAKETVGAIEAEGGRAFAVPAELGVDGDVDTLVAGLTEGLTEHTGAARFDILVNNAATVSFSPLDALTEDEFDRIFAINTKAPLFLVKRTLPMLRDGGRIITISTLATRTAPPAVGYVMSKGAIDVMSRTLAVELGGRGITVNAVAPGVVLTDVFAALREDPKAQAALAGSAALGRVGRPDDIADAVAILASEEARWITGQVIDVTGGLSLRPRTFG